MNMQIADLNTAVELDRAALIQVFGAYIRLASFH